MEENLVKNKNWIKTAIKFIILILFLIGLAFVFRDLYNLSPASEEAGVSVTQPAIMPIVNKKSMVASSSTQLIEAVAASENFKITQVNFGEVVADVLDFSDSGIFQVSGIKSELYFSKGEGQKETRAVISFQTGRQSYAEIEYIKNGETIRKTVSDPYFDRNHIITLPTLDADSVYKYFIIAEDVEGNKIVSDQFVLYTGAAQISLVDILEEAARKVFGWAMK